MENNEKGEFVRSVSKFRQWVRSDGATPFLPEPNRYHLYISWACPWAHRSAIVRSMLGLDESISLSVVDPVWNENGWTFTDSPGSISDFVNHQRDLIDIYRLADPGFKGDETTPVLWDKKNRTIVNNESLDVIQMFATEFLPLARNRWDLYPADLRADIDRVIEENYPSLNNGVYRAGFATGQSAYERAFEEVFGALDRCESQLGKARFLCGSRPTLADVCLFTTLYRFDLVYYSHFKCNRRHVYEFPNLWGFVRDFYQLPGVAVTCFPEQIKRHYYICQTDINPTRIVPVGPAIDFSGAHGRERLGDWAN